MAERPRCSLTSLCSRFCHQLDFSTSGALCVALNKAAAGSAYKCFKDRLVTKAYLALVSSVLPVQAGVWKGVSLGLPCNPVLSPVGEGSR